MRNFKITIEYDGTDFKGWQIQANGERTVQEEIQKALFQITAQLVKVIGSGRTDTGVHALAQVANFKVDTNLDSVDLLNALNHYVPKDISIHLIDEVDDDFHAQYSAHSKTYRYVIVQQSIPSPILSRYASWISYDLNVALMQKEAKLLLGSHNVQVFACKDSSRDMSNSIRTIQELDVTQEESNIIIQVTADGFLYKMVRNIVGALIAVGSSKVPPGLIQRMLESQERSEAFQTAEAKGLFLMRVEY